MGAYSTMKITAADARRVLIEKIQKADDKQLESMLDGLFYDRLFNFWIVTDYDDYNGINWQYRDHRGYIDYD